jgi:hypothetical protein
MPLTSAPQELCCPITQELFCDPVFTADGHTYERHAIERWLAQGKPTSPLTLQTLPNTTLTPNHSMKALCAAHFNSLLSSDKWWAAIDSADLKTLESCSYLPRHLELERRHCNSLHAAAQRGHSAVLRWLLGAGMDVNALTSDHCFTALHLAVLHRQPQAVGALIERSADLDARDKHGRTALSCAVRELTPAENRCPVRFRPLTRPFQSTSHSVVLWCVEWRNEVCAGRRALWSWLKRCWAPAQT